MRLRAFGTRQILPLLMFVILVAQGESPITKEQLRSKYEQKQSRFANFHINYRLRQFNSKSGTLREYERDFYGRGSERAFIDYFQPAEGGSKRKSRKLIEGDNEKRSLAWRSGSPEEAWIYPKTLAQRLDTGVTTPLGYSGLYPITDGARTSYATAANSDIAFAMQLQEVSLLKDTVDVQGSPCVAAVWASDTGPLVKWYFNPKFDYAVVRYESFSRQEGADYVRCAVTLDDFREVSHGLFLPHFITAEGYALENGAAQLTLYNEYTVEAFDLNPTFANDTFELRFPQGAIVHDEILIDTYVEGLSSPEEIALDGLADAVSAISNQDQEANSANARAPSNSIDQNSTLFRTNRGHKTWYRFAFPVLIAIFLIAITAFFAFYEHGRRRPSSRRHENGA